MLTPKYGKSTVTKNSIKALEMTKSLISKKNFVYNVQAAPEPMCVWWPQAPKQ